MGPRYRLGTPPPHSMARPEAASALENAGWVPLSFASLSWPLTWLSHYTTASPTKSILTRHNREWSKYVNYCFSRKYIIYWLTIKYPTINIKIKLIVPKKKHQTKIKVEMVNFAHWISSLVDSKLSKRYIHFEYNLNFKYYNHVTCS